MSADHPAPAVHEIRGNLCFDQYGDSPYWQVGKFIDAVDDATADEEDWSVTVEIDGEVWSVSIGFQVGGLDPRPSDPIDGNLREYRITAHGENERKLPLLIQPRLDWSSSRRPDSVPADLGLATNIKLDQCVNVSPEEIEDLIPRIMRSVANEIGVDWHPDYFTGTPHEYSCITQFELYYRVIREYAQKVVKSDGIFHRLFHLLADHEGSKVVFSADNREIVGYNHQLRMQAGSVSKMIPDGRRPGVQLKHYHPEHVRKKDDSDPLYHPKVGVLYKKGLNGESVPWNKVNELERELEEILVNALEWADVPTKGTAAFVDDWHFDASERSERDVALYDDPTPAIEAEQESVLISTLSRLSDRDRDILERVAVTDGGEHVEEISEDTDWSTSTVYRALSKLGDLLDNDNGNVSFISAKIRDRVRELVDQLDETVAATTRIIEDTLDVDPRDLERKGRAWQNWLTRYGAELVRSDAPNENARIRIREILSTFKADSYDHVGEILEYGRISWIKAGRDPAVFDNALVEYDTKDGGTDVGVARRLIERYGTG